MAGQEGPTPDDFVSPDKGILLEATRHRYDPDKRAFSVGTPAYLFFRYEEDVKAPCGGMRQCHFVYDVTLGADGVPTEVCKKVAKVLKEEIANKRKEFNTVGTYLNEAKMQHDCDRFATNFNNRALMLNKQQQKSAIDIPCVNFVSCDIVFISKESADIGRRMLLASGLESNALDLLERTTCCPEQRICFSLENFLKGQYMKFSNNNATEINQPLPGSEAGSAEVGAHPFAYSVVRRSPQSIPDDDLSLLMTAFAHFSAVDSSWRLLVTDLQGVYDHLTDPQLATNDSAADGDGAQLAVEYAGIGDMAAKAFRKFEQTHKCNKFCKAMGLWSVGERLARRDDYRQQSGETDSEFAIRVESIDEDTNFEEASIVRELSGISTYDSV